MKTKIFILLFILNSLHVANADFIKIDSTKILNKHNELRKNHFNSPLKYSNKLAKSSAKWVKNLALNKKCKMIHSHKENGENIFWQSPMIYKTKKSTDTKWTITKKIVKVDASKPVQEWYNEIKFYNYKKNNCQKNQMCGHYTQVIWKDTKEVGCAAFSCDDKSQLWVCQYSPPGNYIGQKPY